MHIDMCNKNIDSLIKLIKANEILFANSIAVILFVAIAVKIFILQYIDSSESCHPESVDASIEYSLFLLMISASMFLPFILIKNRIVKVFFLAVFLYPLIRLMRNLSLSICCHESYGDVPTEILTFLLLFTVVIIAILPKYKIPIAFLYVVCTVYVFL